MWLKLHIANYYKNLLKYIFFHQFDYYEPMPAPPETYSGIEVAAILKRRTALITQPLQLCVDSGTLTYMNDNRRHRHSRHFLTDISATFLATVIVEGISSEKLYSVKLKATCHITRQSKHQCTASVRHPI